MHCGTALRGAMRSWCLLCPRSLRDGLVQGNAAVATEAGHAHRLVCLATCLYLRVAFGAHRLGRTERSGEYLGLAQLPGSTIAMVDETAHRPLSSPSPFWLLAHHSLGRCDVHRCRWVLLLQLLLRIRRRRLPVITGMLAARRAASSSPVPRKPVCHARSL